MFGLTTKTKTPAAATPTPAPTTDRPSGVEGIIPDGHRWTSKNGVACYKVPVSLMEAVCFLFPEIPVAELTETQLTKLQEILTEANAAANSKDFLVFPVRAEKQTAMNTKFRTNLAAMNRQLRGVSNQSRIAQLLGA